MSGPSHEPKQRRGKRQDHLPFERLREEDRLVLRRAVDESATGPSRLIEVALLNWQISSDAIAQLRLMASQGDRDVQRAAHRLLKLHVKAAEKKP